LATPTRFLRRTRHAWLSPSRWIRRIVFWAGAIAIGLAAVFFAIGSEHAHSGFRKLLAISPWLPLLVTPLGFVAIVYVTNRFFPGSQGSGIPQTIAALEIRDNTLRGRVLSLQIGISKIFLTMFGLLCGASVGREGPTVQVGASILHAVGAFGRFSRADTERALIIAGGAAGVAAAFNTPLAGIVFAIEEMSRSLEQRVSGTVLTAVIMAGVTSLALLGNYTYFGHTSAPFTLSSGWMTPVVCGMVGGLLGGLFSRILILLSRGWPRGIGDRMRERPLLTAAVCGLLLAVVGVASGSSVYGTGYYEARAILEGHEQMSPFYGPLKLLANILSYASGIPGGIFAPSLAVGAGVGMDLAGLFPMVSAGSMILMTMVAYFSGVVQAPITAFVIVVEMTDNHDVILPLMVAALIAHGASKLVCPTPLYRSLAINFLPRRRPQDEA
jgi:H+/Cl- antiporter ClcA